MLLQRTNVTGVLSVCFHQEKMFSNSIETSMATIGSAGESVIC